MVRIYYAEPTTTTTITETNTNTQFSFQYKRMQYNSSPATRSLSNEDLMDELQIVKTEIRGVKRSIGQMLNVQGEMFTMLKNLKRAMEGKHFDLGKCCHTENINKILGAFYCTDGRYPVKNEEKMRLLKQNLMIHRQDCLSKNLCYDARNMKMPSLHTGVVKSADGFWVLLDIKA